MQSHLHFRARSKPVRASRKNPCLVCGSVKWPCSYLPDRSIRFCGKVESERRDSSGETWMHFDAEARSHNLPVQRTQPIPEPRELASATQRHLVYSTFLNGLSLSERHSDDLHRRGLTSDVIARLNYKSTPEPEASDAIAASLSHLGLEGVPGFFFMRGGWCLRWCRPGFFVPHSDIEGRICGMMYRLDVPFDKTKYCWLSSDPDVRNDAGNVKFPKGASSGAPLHWARPELIASSPDIWLTEGALKSDVASFLLGVPFIAAGGVSQWGGSFGERFKRRFPNHRAVIAFDRDWRTNQHVKRALENLMHQLSQARVRYIVRSWNRAEKGIDDLALALSQTKQRRAA
jgi:DNA primase